MGSSQCHSRCSEKQSHPLPARLLQARAQSTSKGCPQGPPVNKHRPKLCVRLVTHPQNEAGYWHHCDLPAHKEQPSQRSVTHGSCGQNRGKLLGQACFCLSFGRGLINANRKAPRTETAQHYIPGKLEEQQQRDDSSEAAASMHTEQHWSCQNPAQHSRIRPQLPPPVGTA